MTQLRSAAPLAASAVLAFALLVSGRASAVECASNADCEKGFECQSVGVTDCAAPAPACPPGEKACDPLPPEPCASTEIKECVPAACASDADCGAGMVCHEWTSTCPTADCACASDQPDCVCDQPACEPETVKTCTPKYALPCTEAADCGMGFTCEEVQSCGCSGSAGTGGGAEPTPPDAAKPLPPDGAAGAPADFPLPDCSCEPSGEKACVPQDITCDTDSECPTGWQCVTDVSVSAPGCAGAGCDAIPAPEPQPTTSHCAPRYYGGVGGGVDVGGTPTSGGVPKGGTGSNGGTQNPEAASGDDNADASESSACQMGHAPASRGALGILVVLGAALGLSRRRAQPRA